MNSILQLFAGKAKFEHNSLVELQNKIQTKRFLKGEILQSQGDRLANAYFVKSGLLRSYVIDKKGKEHTFMFAPEGWIISDISSQFSDEISDLMIDVLENAEVEVLPTRFFWDIFHNYPEFSQDSALILMKRIATLQKRVIMLMSASAAERYEHFLQTYPNVAQRVPQKMIASYLGITPEALSTIRGNLFIK